MRKYTQLKKNERVRIFEGVKRKEKIGEIASAIGRAKSTISRELKRNSDAFGYVYPEEGQARANQRKARHGSKVLRIKGLLEYIKEKFKSYWSPIAIAGRWSKEHPDTPITPEKIYAFIYSKEGKKLGLYKQLPRKKISRGIGRKTTKKQEPVPGKISIFARPESINSRKEPGHFEADLFFNKGSMSSNVLNLVERKSRILFLVKNHSKESTHMAAIINQHLQPYARSVTFDNGSEFAAHHLLQKQGINTYFCTPHSPWQKGSVENANGLLRRFLPFKQPSSSITQSMLDTISLAVNSIPRKSLNFLTPLEVFSHDFKLKNQTVALHS